MADKSDQSKDNTPDSNFVELTWLLSKQLHNSHVAGYRWPLDSSLIETSLSEQNLGKDQIAHQNRTELEHSLTSINKIIERLNNLKEGSPFAIVLLPTFLERKERIIDRIREIESQEEIKKIVVQTDQTPAALQQQLEQLVRMNEKWQSISTELEQERNKAQEALEKQAQEAARHKEEREAFKERWAIWQSFLERESVSTIVGAFLLIIITITQIIASFTHIATTQILDNGFLVILGYFFGQTVAKSRQKDRDENK